jgi:hypothetical protein
MLEALLVAKHGDEMMVSRLPSFTHQAVDN